MYIATCTGVVVGGALIDPNSPREPSAPPLRQSEYAVRHSLARRARTVGSRSCGWRQTGQLASPAAEHLPVDRRDVNRSCQQVGPT